MKRYSILISMLACLLLCQSNSYAQFIEAYGIVQQMTGDQTTSEGASIYVDDNTGGGFGAGFNVGKVNMNIDFIFGSTIIRWDLTELDVKLFLFNANLDYSFIDSWASPVISAGIGSVNFTDSFVSVEKLNENDFSYNWGAGVKCHIKDHYLLKALYRKTWTQIQYTDSKITFDGINIQLGYVF